MITIKTWSALFLQFLYTNNKHGPLMEKESLVVDHIHLDVFCHLEMF